MKKNKPKNTEYYIKAFMENMEVDYKLWKYAYRINQMNNEMKEEFHGKIRSRCTIFGTESSYENIWNCLKGGIQFHISELMIANYNITKNSKQALLAGHNILTLHLDGIEKTFEHSHEISMEDYFLEKQEKENE